MAKTKHRQHKGGRPVNPRASRMHVQIDPDLKRRTIICAANDGIPFHQVLDTALRGYLDKRGIR